MKYGFLQKFDVGVFIFFILVPLLYPLLYAFIYTNEVVREVPVAVVDLSGTACSRDYLRRLDATPDVRIATHCTDMAEARRLVQAREVLGVVCVPHGFASGIARGEQVAVSAYADMSGMLYFKSILAANTNVSLAMNAEIKVQRAGGGTKEQQEVVRHPLTYDEVALFNPHAGFAVFLIPAVLVLVLQQTLVLGAGMEAGTMREENLHRRMQPVQRRRGGLWRLVAHQAGRYLLVYVPMSVYVLAIVPHLFRLPQLADPWQLGLFVFPFLLACAFFAITVSGLVRHRETGIVLVVFSSAPLLFVSGISWPGSAMPPVWEAVSYLFPSTFGIRGFVAMNNMGAPLHDVMHAWLMLWVQTVIYALCAMAVTAWSVARSRRQAIRERTEARRRRLALMQ